MEFFNSLLFFLLFLFIAPLLSSFLKNLFKPQTRSKSSDEVNPKIGIKKLFFENLINYDKLLLGEKKIHEDGTIFSKVSPYFSIVPLLIAIFLIPSIFEKELFFGIEDSFTLFSLLLFSSFFLALYKLDNEEKLGYFSFLFVNDLLLFISTLFLRIENGVSNIKIPIQIDSEIEIFILVALFFVVLSESILNLKIRKVIYLDGLYSMLISFALDLRLLLFFTIFTLSIIEIQFGVLVSIVIFLLELTFISLFLKLISKILNDFKSAIFLSLVFILISFVLNIVFNF